MVEREEPTSQDAQALEEQSPFEQALVEKLTHFGLNTDYQTRIMGSLSMADGKTASTFEPDEIFRQHMALLGAIIMVQIPNYRKEGFESIQYSLERDKELGYKKLRTVQVARIAQAGHNPGVAGTHYDNYFRNFVDALNGNLKRSTAPKGILRDNPTSRGTYFHKRSSGSYRD